MIKTRHSTLYAISGIIWLGIGMMLLNLGLGFLCASQDVNYILIALGIIIGFAKGRFVMQKAALRSHERIAKLENPTTISQLYTRSNILIIACMMGLGMLMKILQLPNDVRGFIDTAVGCALMQGSLAYFRLMAAPVPNK